ncbi:MAG TPA: glycine betaine ABC transporter substrate-binding protein [Ktedonobacterales bacterium]|jgi:osmoprotectant transport system substrate-binding protein|nr:glycine betaine ABC transporter substrate-binding protein [Ktedonobacterales bacterium]
MRLLRSRGVLSAALLALALALPLAACGSSGSGSGKPGSGVTVVVGSKLDPDGQLLGEMYALLLQNQGYTVTTKLALGQTPVLFNAIKSGAIDIYPEFTGTAATRLNIPATQDAQALFNSVKSADESQNHLTWLDAAYGLNDSYAICTSQQVSSSKSLTTLDQLTTMGSSLTVASPQDGIDAAVNPVQNGYGFKFKNVTQISEPLGFDAVKQGSADVNVCYTSDPAIVVNNFVVLKDSKNVFPIYNPAPVVRDSVMQKSPAIATTLNALAPKLTTAAQIALIKQVAVDHQSVVSVAKTFLQQQGLLPK